MSRYRGSKYGGKYRAKSGYLTKEEVYRILQKYQKRHRSPKYPTPKYRGRSSGRSGRSSTSNRYRSRQQSTRSPAPQYKKMPKLNLSSPLRERPVRYSLQSHISRTEIDTEQLANQIENRLDSKLSRILLEKLEADVKELQQKIEAKGINENSETSEEKTESQETGVAESRANQEAIEEKVEHARSIEAESESKNETETNKEAEADNESVDAEPPKMTENLYDVEADEIEGEMENTQKADHLEAYIIDEDWIDEDGVNTLFWSESEPEQVEQETEVSEEPELIPPDIELETEPIDEAIEPEEIG